jgi:hypothetical protein
MGCELEYCCGECCAICGYGCCGVGGIVVSVSWCRGVGRAATQGRVRDGRSRWSMRLATLGHVWDRTPGGVERIEFPGRRVRYAKKS